ncbi:MAG: nucleotide exchange factor GrpE [Chloroflexi bacterium]|nr:nucleotide exchange factor GrpE [Chloroflexota bacterium]
MINEEERTKFEKGPEETPEPNDIPSLKKALEEEKTKTLQYLYNWQRAQADLLNYKKSSERDRQEAVKYGNAVLLLNLLPALDDLQRAIDSVPAGAAAPFQESAGRTSWTEGVRLIQKKLLAALQANGLVALESVGQPFDPFVHEAIGYQEGEESRVLAEVEKGYKLYDKVLRPAKVIVGKGKTEEGRKE